MGPLFSAIRFLTILPLPSGQQETDQDWGRATAWYPAVGLVIGVLLAALDWALRWLWPDAVATALVLAARVALTGALHLDGFIDCCDALLAPVPPQRRLQILRDVHAGAFGIVGVVILLLTKYAALAAAPAELRLPSLILIPTLARWAMVGAVWLFPYARSGTGLGQKARTGSGLKPLLTAAATAFVVAVLCWWGGLGWGAPILVLLTVVLSALVGIWIQSRLGGLTGDAYGALCELVEAACLLTVAAVLFGGLLP